MADLKPSELILIVGVLIFILKEIVTFLSKVIFKKLDTLEDNSKKITELTMTMVALRETLQQTNLRIDNFNEITGMVYKLKNDMDAAHQMIRDLRGGNA